MSGGWVPQPAGLREVLETLHTSTRSQDTEVQKAITLKLEHFTKVPDYVGYLAHVTANLSQETEHIRTIAGYLLKNNASLLLKAPPEVAAFAQSAILQAFRDPQPMIRKVAGQVIVSFLRVLDPKNWTEALTLLVHSLDSPQLEEQESAFDALEKACQDFPRKLDIDMNGTRPLDFMVPKFLMLSEHPSPRIRSHAIGCLFQLIHIQSQSLFAHIDNFIACLFKRASDDDAIVRKNVCQALVLLLAFRPDKLIPEMSNVAEYMLYSTRDKNEDVALEACDFWLTFAEEPDLEVYLRPLLPKVAFALLECMVYSEQDLDWAIAEEDDAHIPDKESDIKPKHYGAKEHGLERASQASGSGTNGTKQLSLGGDEGDDLGDEFDDDDMDEFDDEMGTEWNVRKCAAAAFDVLATRFGGELMEVSLPVLKDKLWSPDWLQRECGILALGAMAEGCIDVIVPHLPVLVPYLINMLNDAKPLVRSITCWTLGRYASWIAQIPSDEHRLTYFVPTMEGLLRMVLDNHKRVQEAGCSAFSTLEEEAQSELEPFLDPVLRNLVFAFDKYQAKNLLILYDAVGTLADAVGGALANPAYVEILMPPLIKRWTKLKDDPEDLVPLLECLASVTVAMGTSFAPYAGPIYDRCCNIVQEQLLQYQSFQQNPEMDEPDKDILVVTIDLLSGIIQGLGMQIKPLLESSSPPLFTLIGICLKHPQPSVRQSSYALIGDMAVQCFELLRPFMPQIMPEIVAQLYPDPKPDEVSACNNAAWSVGEVALRYGSDPEFAQWVPGLIHQLIPCLLHAKAPRSLHENAAVTIGRIGLVQPQTVAPQLELFAEQWCQALLEIRDNEEKDSAFRGFCTLVQVNPQGIAKSFFWFCNAIAQWVNPTPELNEMFKSWNAQFGSFPTEVQEKLRQRYNL
ncbi:armadillo-type protein [Hysterangium stoloniferum]|nr:armadillo-type protein [Hysterangium stoloniferum]